MITKTQIRMAKAGLGLSNPKLEKITGLHRNTINKAERGIGRNATFALLRQALEEQGATFQGEHCVCVKTEA